MVLGHKNGKNLPVGENAKITTKLTVHNKNCTVHSTIQINYWRPGPLAKYWDRASEAGSSYYIGSTPVTVFALDQTLATERSSTTVR